MIFKNYFFSILFILILFSSVAQQVQRALFIGNSYTAYNNLPQMVSQCATSTGDQLIFDSSTPGGTTFQSHTTNTTTIAKIEIGDWDYVALQEQSQRPSFPDAQVAQEVFPYASTLNDMIKQHNPCAETVFYMTWGRKNGDANNCAIWPPVCTYLGMDSLLNLRYMQMASMNSASVSPVGAVWRYLRENHPTLELYDSDGSHPSYAGSYAAACSFYTVIFRKNPNLITWNGTLSVQEAQIIREAAKLVVFDNLGYWRVGFNDPIAEYAYTNSDAFNYTFENQSQNFETSTWYINGVQTSTDENLNHMFSVTGVYTVMLVVEKCGRQSSFEQVVLVGGMSVPVSENQEIVVFPNPVENKFIVKNAANIDLRVSDISGKTLDISTESDNCDASVDVSNLTPGFYLLHLAGQQIVFVKL